MAYEITSESYGRRLPKITATATSTDDLATLGTNWAEGSTCTISDTTYKLDKVKGWVDPNSGGGGGASAFTVTFTPNESWTEFTSDKTLAEVLAAYEAGSIINGRSGTEADGYTMVDFFSVDDGYAFFKRIEVDPDNEPALLYYEVFKIMSDSLIHSFYSYSLTAAE